LTKKLQLQLLGDFVPRPHTMAVPLGFAAGGLPSPILAAMSPKRGDRSTPLWSVQTTRVHGRRFTLTVNTARRVIRPMNTGSVYLAPVSRVHGPCWPKHFHVMHLANIRPVHTSDRPVSFWTPVNTGREHG